MTKQTSRYYVFSLLLVFALFILFSTSAAQTVKVALRASGPEGTSSGSSSGEEGTAPSSGETKKSDRHSLDGNLNTETTSDIVALVVIMVIFAAVVLFDLYRPNFSIVGSFQFKYRFIRVANWVILGAALAAQATSRFSFHLASTTMSAKLEISDEYYMWMLVAGIAVMPLGAITSGFVIDFFYKSRAKIILFLSLVVHGLLSFFLGFVIIRAGGTSNVGGGSEHPASPSTHSMMTYDAIGLMSGGGEESHETSSNWVPLWFLQYSYISIYVTFCYLIPLTEVMLIKIIARWYSEKTERAIICGLVSVVNSFSLYGGFPFNSFVRHTYQGRIESMLFTASGFILVCALLVLLLEMRVKPEHDLNYYIAKLNQIEQEEEKTSELSDLKSTRLAHRLRKIARKQTITNTYGPQKSIFTSVSNEEHMLEALDGSNMSLKNNSLLGSSPLGEQPLSTGTQAILPSEHTGGESSDDEHSDSDHEDHHDHHHHDHHGDAHSLEQLAHSNQVPTYMIAAVESDYKDFTAWKQIFLQVDVYIYVFISFLGAVLHEGFFIWALEFVNDLFQDQVAVTLSIILLCVSGAITSLISIVMNFLFTRKSITFISIWAMICLFLFTFGFFGFLGLTYHYSIAVISMTIMTVAFDCVSSIMRLVAISFGGFEKTGRIYSWILAASYVGAAVGTIFNFYMDGENVISKVVVGGAPLLAAILALLISIRNVIKYL